MNIPANIILLWAGLNSAIPSGYVRETALDGRFSKGASAGLAGNVTGGASTHTHTSPNHTHTMNAHSHNIVSSSDSHEAVDGSRTGDGSGNLRNSPHTHSGAIPINSSSVSNTAVTYSAMSNNPPYYELIFIKATTGAILQNNIIALWAGFNGDTTTPTNWQFCDGTSPSPDLRNQYIRGAAAAGNPGATGGSTSNTHDISHGHTDSHTHNGNTGGPSFASSPKQDGGSSGSGYRSNHVHNVTLNNANGSVSSTISLTPPEVVEPLYKKLAAIQRKSGGLRARGIIGMWLGSLSSIPKGWVLCDGSNGTPDMRDYHLKIANSAAEIGNTGGSNTHTHAAQSHSHTAASSHSHSGSIGTYAGDGAFNTNGSGQNYWHTTQTHSSLASIDSQTVSYAASNTTADSSNNEPLYTTVNYIQFQRAFYGGAIIAGLL